MLIITSGEQFNIDSLDWIDKSVTIYYATGLQDALFHLTIISYHLIIIEKGQDEEITRSIIETIRTLKKTPILVFMA